MLFIHDIHNVIGEHEFEFEDAVRDEYAPAVAEDGARLLWYLHATHGSGEAYRIITLTAVPDGAAWERLTERLRYGDLASWSARADAWRYDSTSSLLVQTPWSPAGHIDLDEIAVTAQTERDVVLMREDTLDGPGAIDLVSGPVGTNEGDTLRCVAAFTPAIGDAKTLRILYELAPRDQWTEAFGTDTGWGDWSGSVTPVLPDTVTRAGHLLRTTTWSPWP